MWSCETKDDLGQLIHLTHPAERIVSLAPDLTETLFAIGAGKHVVGVISPNNYPPLAANIALVGSYSGLDLERILSLHPDLIITWGTFFAKQLALLHKMGITIYTANPIRLEDIPHTFKNLGCLTGKENQATQQAAIFSTQLAKLNMLYHRQKRVSVFYQIGAYSLFTINKNSWINQVINLCAGRNVFAEATFTNPTVSWEEIFTTNPQVVISDATAANWQRLWLAWPQLGAVKHHLLFTINPDLIERASPRLLQGAHQLCIDLQRARQSR